MRHLLDQGDPLVALGPSRDRRLVHDELDLARRHRVPERAEELAGRRGERFAFEQAWSKRDDAFRRELCRRHEALTATIDAGDDAASILAELDLHGLVYEASGHRLLQRTWQSLRGRLQLYWAAHHRAHATRGPRRDAHDSYVVTALGNDLDAMLAEISSHMGRGAQQTEKFLELAIPSTAPQEN